MKTQEVPPTRSSQWEDEAPAEARVRRVRRSAPPSGRVLPGMPLEMADPDGDGTVRFGGAAFRDDDYRDNSARWWRPTGTAGRVFVGLCATLALAGLITVILLFQHYLQRDARFRIEGSSNIQATGLAEVSRDQMLPVFGEDIGRNVFFVPLAERRRELEKIPWVEHATVMRLLPNQLRVSVVERKPVAFVRHGNQVGLVDANGVLLSMDAATMAQRHYSFPVLTGIDPGDPLTARKARIAMYLRLMSDLDSTGQHYSQQLSEIDLTDPEDARVTMPEQGADILAHFGQDHFLERYQRYKQHIADWRQQYPNLSAVDLRYNTQVVLQMASGASATDTKPSAEGTVQAAPPEAVKPKAAASKKKTAARPSTVRSHAVRSHHTVAPVKTAAERRRELEKKRRALAAHTAWRGSIHKPSSITPQTTHTARGD